MNIIAILLCGILYRLDGWGKGDGFLPIPPFNKLRMGGINYARYAIIPIVFLITHNYWHIATYLIAVSIPYGEKHWWMQYGLLSWFGIGLIWGAASLSWGVSLWFGALLTLRKALDTDQAWLEFGIFGIAGMLWLAFVR